MRKIYMSIITGLIFAAIIPAAEKTANLNGTWTLNPARSDSGGQNRRPSRVGGIPGLGGGFPGGISISRRGVGYPGGVCTPGEVTLTRADIPAAGAQEEIRLVGVGMTVEARETVCREGRYKTLLWK